MKTKIVYISGGEIFNPKEIQCALDEIRQMMNLAPDIVIFGIPVDNNIESVVVENLDVEIEPETPEIIIENDPVETVIEIPENIPQINHSNAPILSVLGNIQSEPEMVEIADDFENIQTPVTEEIKIENETVILEQKSESVELKIIKQEITFDDEPSEFLADFFAGKPEEKKTLEQIFDGLESLKEEKRVDISSPVGVKQSPVIEDMDATLSKMAEEFMAVKDNIPDVPVKNGKLGKLKNVLPFKKAKKEEPSLIGDLFGWAGIAANDDDFASGGLFGIK